MNLTSASSEIGKTHQEHQFQQEQEEGIRPVLRMYSACCSVFVAWRFLLASASALFSSALCLAAASLFISLSWARPLILSTSTYKNKHSNKPAASDTLN